MAGEAHSLAGEVIESKCDRFEVGSQVVAIGYELGVERLSPRIQPVWVRPLRSHRKASPEPGLFVPGVSALKQPDRLLLPSHIYQTGMDAEVWHTPQQYTVKFDRRTDFTPSFDLINFTVLTKEPAQ